MLISTTGPIALLTLDHVFQSLDWVGVDFDLGALDAHLPRVSPVSIPRLG